MKNYLKTFVKNKKISNKDLARLFNIRVPFVWRVINGKKPCPLYWVNELACVYSLDKKETYKLLLSVVKYNAYLDYKHKDFNNIYVKEYFK